LFFLQLNINKEREVIVANRRAKRKSESVPLVLFNEGKKYMGRFSVFTKTGTFIKNRKPLESDSPKKIILKTESKMGIHLFFHAFTD